MLTLVLLPGMDGSGDLFAPVIAELGSDVTPIVVSYPDQPLGYQELIEHARRALPATGDFFLLGESFSGPIAVTLAAECGPRLRGLILSATFIRNPMPWTRPLRFLAGALPVTGTPASLLTIAVLGRFDTPALRAMIGASLAKVSAPALRTRLKAIACVDVSARISSIKAPILYLRAAHDRVVFRSACRLISRLQPAMRCVTLDAPHFLLQVAARDAAREIRAFMQDAQS